MEGVGEELRAEEGEPGEIGIGEAPGFEEIDGDQNVIDGIGEREAIGFGLGVNNTENFEVTKVFTVGCAELKVISGGFRVRVGRKGVRARRKRTRRKRKRMKHFLGSARNSVSGREVDNDKFIIRIEELL